MRTIKSIEWRAEQRALKHLEALIRKEITGKIVELQQWIENEEKEKPSSKSDIK